MAEADLTPARHVAAPHSYHGLRAGAALFAAAGAVGFITLATGVANADSAPTPRVVEGNVTTCGRAGLTGEIILRGGSGSASSDAGTGTVTGKTLDVTINAGFTATGIAVKGGPNTNVYDGPFVGPTEVESMVAPTNQSGQPAGISHWLVCGSKTTSSTPPSTPPSSPPSTPPSSTPPSSTPVVAPTDTASPPAGQLPVTGGSIWPMLGGSAALLASGAMLIVLARRRRKFVA